MALEPKYFSSDLHALVFKQLRKEYEGKSSVKYGYTLAFLEIQQIDGGRLNEDSGNAEYRVQSKALAYRPIKNEITEGEIHKFNDVSFFHFDKYG